MTIDQKHNLVQGILDVCDRQSLRTYKGWIVGKSHVYCGWVAWPPTASDKVDTFPAFDGPHGSRKALLRAIDEVTA